MRIIKEKTLKDYCNSAKYRSASILNSKRVVFNIKGNEFRLIVDVEYKMKLVFVVWFGTHMEYDKINALKVDYDH